MTDNEGISVADALALRNSGASGFGGFDGNGWWIILLILLFGGWNRGFGGNGGGTVVEGYSPCCTPATAQGVTDAFNFSAVSGAIRDTQDALAADVYEVNSGIKDLGTSLQNVGYQNQLATINGFNGVQQSIAAMNLNNI